MNVDDLARRIDVSSAQIVDVRDRFRSIDPHDRGGVAASVARLHDLLGDLLASESQLSAQQTALQEQQAVRETEPQQYWDLFELVPVAILMTDSAGVIEQANRAAADLLGVPVDSLIGESLIVFVAERSAREELSTEFVRLARTAPSTLEYKASVGARGGAFPALVTASAARGPAGAVAGLHWLMRRSGEAESPPGVPEDGSRLERRAAPYGAAVTGAEADHRSLLLVGSEAADCPYRRLFDAAVDAIVLFDPDRRLVEANPAARELLGYGRHEIGHVRLDDLVARDTEQLGAIMASLQRDGAWHGELEMRRRDGGLVPVDAAVATVTLPTGVAVRVGLRDITNRRRLHDERERTRREVLSMVGHELLDALNGILLHAEILTMTGRYRKRSVDAIVASAHREQRLIEADTRVRVSAACRRSSLDHNHLLRRFVVDTSA
ncbi:MAG TPA: PAS domain S-box protein [Chloroflexota bacterium]|nr:PAS domain S-box protein [Chloroflexota bacterium]